MTGICLKRCLLAVAFVGGICSSAAVADEPLDIGDDRQLFVDEYVIDRMEGVALRLHHPVDAGPVLAFDLPHEGPFCAYVTILKDGTRYRAYYRGLPVAGADGSDSEVTCYAESPDGIHWTKPDLKLFEVGGSLDNNVILAKAKPFSHNFSPLLDRRPGVPEGERYKALAGTGSTGLFAFASADGVRWKKLRETPVIQSGAFDSQNVAFWSEAEQGYCSYFRVFAGGFRRIARTTSPDFVQWTEPVLMHYGDKPIEHLYTNQTHPYFRAPQIYIAIAARFMPGRRVLTPDQAEAINVHPRYFGDCSDAVLLSTRGGDRYARTFVDGFIRPGIGLENWVSRTNYPALNVVPTGPAEMSVYVNQNYGQPTAHLRRYRLRTDGFVSVHATAQGGELVTRPLRFQGQVLTINHSSSAAGGIRVEIQDASGQPIPGYTLGDALETIGNEIDRVVYWKSGPDTGALEGRTVRLRFQIKDADLYSFRFGGTGS